MAPIINYDVNHGSQRSHRNPPILNRCAEPGGQMVRSGTWSYTGIEPSPRSPLSLSSPPPPPGSISRSPLAAPLRTGSGPPTCGLHAAAPTGLAAIRLGNVPPRVPVLSDVPIAESHCRNLPPQMRASDGRSTSWRPSPLLASGGLPHVYLGYYVAKSRLME